MNDETAACMAAKPEKQQSISISQEKMLTDADRLLTDFASDYKRMANA